MDMENRPDDMPGPWSSPVIPSEMPQASEEMQDMNNPCREGAAFEEDGPTVCE